MLLLLPLSFAATLQVGPDKAYATPCAAAAVAKDGDTVEIDAGTYTGDVCAWDASNLPAAPDAGQLRGLTQSISGDRPAGLRPPRRR